MLIYTIHIHIQNIIYMQVSSWSYKPYHNVHQNCYIHKYVFEIWYNVEQYIEYCLKLYRNIKSAFTLNIWNHVMTGLWHLVLLLQKCFGWNDTYLDSCHDRTLTFSFTFTKMFQMKWHIFRFLSWQDFDI